MKILVICQYYYPEPFRIADICEELVRRGNEVSVVTGTPNYPMGEIYPGYERGQKTDEVLNGVKVHRCRIHPRKTGAIHRVWNYSSFPHQSKRYIKKLDDSYDVVFVYQLSPVMMAEAGLWYAKKHHKKSVLYCLDLWPASLGVGGINRGIIYRWFHGVSKRIYGKSDLVLLSSKSFSGYFKEQFDRNDTDYLSQYAETSFSPDVCKKIPNDTIDLMFAGNIGTAQSVETIVKAAALCKDIPQVHWHIVGDGIALEGCKALVEEGGGSITFYGRQPMSEMPRYYALADAMLVTMKKDPIISMTLPGKVQSYMAAGKPILGAIDGEASSVIRDAECGFCCGAEDAEGLAECVREFVRHNNIAEFSKNAITYYAQHFSKEIFIDHLEQALSTEEK